MPSAPAVEPPALLTVTVSSLEDDIFEPDETFSVAGSAVSGTVATGDTGTGTILNDDDAPSLNISDATATEGDLLVFDLTLSNPSFETIVVSLNTGGGSALEGTDYTSIDGALVTFLAGQLAGSLGWVTISAEESPELLQCAPVTPDRIRRAKIAAVLIPVLGLIGLPLLWLVILDPIAGVVGILGAAVTAASTTMIELWRQRPGKRNEFRRNRGSSVLVPMIEVLIGLSYGATGGLVLLGYYVGRWWVAAFAVVPLLIAVGVTFASRPRSADETAVVVA